MDTNKMREHRAEADARVLQYLQGCLGSTAWAMSGAVRLAIWNEGKMPLFSGMADAVVDEFMAKEASHD